MSEVVNLRRARRAKALGDREVQAAANRAAFGRTKAEKDADRAARERNSQALDGAKLER